MKKNCLACAHSGMEPDSPGLICYAVGTFGKYLKEEPLCGPDRPKFQKHPGRNPDGSLKWSKKKLDVEV